MGHMTAKVAVAKAIYAIDRPYDYRVPQELEGRLRPGMRVLVPFGAGNRRTEGIVLALEGGRPDDPRRKAILTLLDEEPVLDAPELRLALWMRERYFCTVYDAARAMLPAGLYFSLQDRWQLAPGMDEEAAYEAAGRSERARRVLELIFASGGWADVAQLKEAFGTKDPNPALKLLRDKGVLTLETSASRGVGDKKELVAALDIPPEEAMAQVTPKRRSAPLRYAVTELLCALGSASAKELCYFTGASNSTLRSLAKSGILRLEQREVYRRVAVEPGEWAAPPVLNAEQQAAFDGLDALAVEGKPAAALLYGVTGSGKTQIYLRLIYAALGRGRNAMVLVPEISLTPQLLRIFAAVRRRRPDARLLLLASDAAGVSALIFVSTCAAGILIFFNHFGKKRFTVDPTPMEVQMRLYENDIQTTLVEDYARKGEEIDVDSSGPSGSHRR